MYLINTVYIHIANTIKYIAVSFFSIDHFRNYLSMKTVSSKKSDFNNSFLKKNRLLSLYLE